MTPQLWIWIGFGAFVLAMLALDLGVSQRQAQWPERNDDDANH